MTAWGFMEVFWDQWNICKYVWLVCGEKRKAGAMDLYQNGPGGGGRSPSGCSGCHRTLLLAAFSFRCLTGRHYWIYHIFICMCPFKICQYWLPSVSHRYLFYLSNSNSLQPSKIFPLRCFSGKHIHCFKQSKVIEWVKIAAVFACLLCTRPSANYFMFFILKIKFLYNLSLNLLVCVMVYNNFYILHLKLYYQFIILVYALATL